jgi:hypothetical protein
MVCGAASSCRKDPIVANDYLYRDGAHASTRERRAIDYAPFKRQLTPSLRPASVLGPAAVIILLAILAGLLAGAYSLSH